jgi:hypothetical protein
MKSRKISKKKKAGTPTLSGIPDDITLKYVSKVDFRSLKLLNMTNKSYRSQLKPYLTTNKYPSQFSAVHKDAGILMDNYGITLKDILLSSIETRFFDNYIKTFFINDENERIQYICNILFDYNDDVKTELNKFETDTEITKDFLKLLQPNSLIFKKINNYSIDYRIFQFLLLFTDINMKGRSKTLMKILLTKQLIIFLQSIYLDKLLHHYEYLKEYPVSSINTVLLDLNVHIESYLFHSRFKKAGYIIIENSDIFFFYFYSVIVTSLIFHNTIFDNLPVARKYSIKKGMIYDMLYYIKSMYTVKNYNYRNEYTILYLFNLYTFVEKDTYLKIFISLILFSYLNHLFEKKIVTARQLYSSDTSFIIERIHTTILEYIEILPTLEFDKIGLKNKKEVDIEIKKDILLKLMQNLENK